MRFLWNLAPSLFWIQWDGQGPPCDLKELWSGGCQSLVKIIGAPELLNFLMYSLRAGMILSPSGTASAPPGQKSFWTSTTINAVRLSIWISNFCHQCVLFVTELSLPLTSTHPRLAHGSRCVWFTIPFMAIRGVLQYQIWKSQRCWWQMNGILFFLRNPSNKWWVNLSKMWHKNSAGSCGKNFYGWYHNREFFN